MEHPIKTKEIHGVEVKFHVDSEGNFYTNSIEGVALQSKTLAELEAEATKILAKKAKAKTVKVTLVGIGTNTNRWGEDFGKGDGVAHALLRGFTDRTSSFLLTIDGKKTKLGSWVERSICRELTEAEIKEWDRRQLAVEKAAKDLEAWMVEHRLAAPRTATEGE